MLPKGTVIIIGGAEDKGNSKKDPDEENKYAQKFEILKELIPSKGNKKIEIITTASNVAAEVQKMYKDAFKKMHFNNVGFIDINDKEGARKADFCQRIEKAHSVLFSGGDQFKLSTTLGGTDILKQIKERFIHDSEFIVAGTSAGAMAMSKIMIYEGGVKEAILKADIKMSMGLGLLDTCIIDTHFIKRGRFGRLAHAVIMNPESLGIGLGEDTALIIKKGTDAQCLGSGMVVVIDGDQIQKTNITDIDDGMPIFVENLMVHLLVNGTKFSLKEKRVAGNTIRKTADAA